MTRGIDLLVVITLDQARTFEYIYECVLECVRLILYAASFRFSIVATPLPVIALSGQLL